MRVDPPFGWADGPTNRMDALFDAGLKTKAVAKRLHIPLRITRRRRQERRALDARLHRPIIPPDRQLEIAMAALYPNEPTSKENT